MFLAILRGLRRRFADWIRAEDWGPRSGSLGEGDYRGWGWRTSSLVQGTTPLARTKKSPPGTPSKLRTKWGLEDPRRGSSGRSSGSSKPDLTPDWDLEGPSPQVAFWRPKVSKTPIDPKPLGPSPQTPTSRVWGPGSSRLAIQLTSPGPFRVLAKQNGDHPQNLSPDKGHWLTSLDRLWRDSRGKVLK